MSRGLSVLVLCLWSVSCGREAVDTRWERELLAADRALDHGEFEGARAALEGLLPRAPTAADSRYVALRLAVVAEERADYRSALGQYRGLWAGDVRDDVAAQALHRSARLWANELGREDRGLEIWRRLMILMPSSGFATTALDEILDRLHSGRGPREALVFLTAHYRLLRGTEIGDNLLYERAKQLAAGGHVDEAAESYELLIDHHPMSGLRDDAMWHLADLEVRRGRPQRALLLLRYLTEDQDASWYLGAYDSSYGDDARFLRGLIFLGQFHSPADARVEFETFVAEFPESILRDDARWNAIQCWLQAGDGGGALDACDALAETEPESRYVAHCLALRASLERGLSPTSLASEVIRP